MTPQELHAAIDVVRGADLPRQAYAYSPGHDVRWTRPENFRPVTGKRRWVKPDPGTGFWTATVTETTQDGRPLRTSWTEWCTAEEFGHYTGLIEVYPDPDARVVRIDTLADLHAVVAAYPTEPACHSALVYPDWVAMAADWDGVFLTEAGQWRTRLPRGGGPDLYGWDCESVLWLQPTYRCGEAT